ncbi:uncharacterized protein L201_000573 [Kwoniella dendrophila CBS 6074]|uniref:F-box domain-containing protein n=1 Tax=Kwoniella dendrophila CBS 6074 TaxID=1295534 RepID=A0AAX4JLP1_9TREE
MAMNDNMTDWLQDNLASISEVDLIVPSPPAHSPSTSEEGVLRKSVRIKAKTLQQAIEQETDNNQRDDENDENDDSEDDLELSALQRGRKSINKSEKPKRRIKKPLLARQVEWNDIPSWAGRDDCPLLELPGEILDLCFGTSISNGLTLRDYVSLAGVCRFFRHQMTNTVFSELYYNSEAGKKSGMNPPRTKHSESLFTRTVLADWKYPKKEKITYPKLSYGYIPRGERSSWDEADYIVYKKEQSFARLKYRLRVEIDRRHEIERKTILKNILPKTVFVGTQCRSIMGRVRGRMAGQPPVQKKEDGIPEEPFYLDINEKDGYNDDRDKDKAMNNANYAPPTDISKYAKRRIAQKVAQVKSTTIGGIWETPETDPEDNEEEDEEEEGDDKDKSKGKNDITYWPSVYREKAVEAIHSTHIGKSEAIKEFRITEAEFLCLKHILVANPMNRRAPQQIFWRAAVEALAYRSHGGPFGHQQHIQRSETIIEKGRNTRQRNIEKAKEEGTFSGKKRKHRLLPSEWKEQESKRARTSVSEDQVNNGQNEEEGVKDGDVDMKKEGKDNHQYCEEGCDCQKKMFK